MMTPNGKNPAVQPSISTFFKRKSLPLTSSTHKSAAEPSNSSLGGLLKGSIDDDDVVDLTTSPPAGKKPRLSSASDISSKTPAAKPSASYFSNRSSGPRSTSAPTRKPGVQPIEVDPNTPVLSSSRVTTFTSLDIPTLHNTSLTTYRLPTLRPALPSQSGSAFEKYTLITPSSTTGDDAEVPLPSSQTRNPAQQKRHEEWQKRLAGNGILPRRRSLALDEAAAAEARGMLGTEDGSAPTGDDDPTAVDGDGNGEVDEGTKQAEAVGSKLKAKFAAKGSEVKSGKGKGKKREEVGPSGQTYTPLEKQFMEIKGEYPDALLMMEVGYRYQFHGDDAKNASRELGIVAFPHRNFYTASIPVHRMHIHVKKLISLGYKVGIISQMETAALKKVGENRNAPFTRELTHLFTAATYVEDASMASSSNLADEPILPGTAPPPTNALVAIVEKGMGGQAVDERVRIAMISVVPGTGDVVWDEFDDSQVRTELETRLTHLQPAELLLPAEGLSKATNKVLQHFACPGKTGGGNPIRVERIKEIMDFEAAFNHLTKFYKRKGLAEADSNKESGEIDMTGDSDNGERAPEAMQDEKEMNGSDPMGLAAGLPAEETVLALADFPKQVVIALSVAVKYMKSFRLENAFRHRSSFTRFVNRAHMLLSSNTLVNLEIYQNQTDGSIHGSLLWLLDHTKTRMGRRLMREWIGRPLLDVAALQARVDAIEEIINSNTYHMEKLRSLLVNMPDLVKGLTRVQYGKATPTEMATILVGLNRIASEFKSSESEVFASPLLNSIMRILPSIRDKAREFLNDINVKEARENIEANLWNDPDKYPDIQDAKDCISVCEGELDEHLKEIRKVLHRPSLAYVTVAGIEYLFEVPVRDAKSVPPKWVKVSATKSVNRYHTPDILRITKEREQHKETLAAASKRAFQSFQSDISECHSLLVVARQIAVIDCLMSLAQVAAASGYCKPKFVAQACLHVKEGRHPMVEMLRDEAYVPFDIHFSEEDGVAKVITGPNMAGKSSCVRATALIVCMAQIGSFVPASSVTLGIHDAVQTRMGASDEIGRGKSTFMVELSETSDIIRTVTPRTLVILDELGRGTSTYDGVAIAYATLSHLAGVGCSTLFVTHYPMVAEELAKEYPQQISNWHMSFDEIKLPDGSAEITFLYKLTRGLAEASFGVWCARLAGLPKAVLQTAQLRADQLKYETEQRLIAALARKSQRLLVDAQSSSATPGTASETLKNASSLYKALRLATKA